MEQTTVDDINEKVREKDKGFFNKIGADLIDRNIPKCPICRQLYTNGAMTYSDANVREPINICIPCVFKAIGFYVSSREKALKK